MSRQLAEIVFFSSCSIVFRSPTSRDYLSRIRTQYCISDKRAIASDCHTQLPSNDMVIILLSLIRALRWQQQNKVNRITAKGQACHDVGPDLLYSRWRRFWVFQYQESGKEEESPAPHAQEYPQHMLFIPKDNRKK